MAIVLGPHRYGKAENRLVRIVRDGPRHEIRDLTVSTSLRGDFDAAHTVGDQSQVLPTDSQKQTVYAYAREKGVGAPEHFALTLARHFVDDVAPVSQARVEVEEHAWQRVEVDGRGHDHTWRRTGPETRTCAVTVEGRGADQRVHVVGGVTGLTLLKSTGSEFRGFLVDPYTVLEPAEDRILATALTARWRYRCATPDGAPGGAGTLDGVDVDDTYRSVLGTLVQVFAELHSLALQQTLHEMGRAVLEKHPQLAEVRLVAPNKHHVLHDLSPFGLDNPGEVFHATDRPYGLIQACVLDDTAPHAGPAWDDAGRA